MRLSDLLSAERIVADYTFYNALDSYASETLDEERRRCADEARRKLWQIYLDFKRADSPESARLLIRQVEEQGAKQGKRINSRAR